MGERGVGYRGHTFLSTMTDKHEIFDQVELKRLHRLERGVRIEAAVDRFFCDDEVLSPVFSEAADWGWEVG